MNQDDKMLYLTGLFQTFNKTNGRIYDKEVFIKYVRQYEIKLKKEERIQKLQKINKLNE